MKQTLFMVLWVAYAVSALAASTLPTDLLELQVKGLAVDPNLQVPVAILESPAAQKAFPIWIGQSEAQAIAIELEGVSTPRPLTHILLKNILTQLDVQVQRIVIHDVRNRTFYASVWLQHGAAVHTIDARPSDAIALALGTKAPIFVAPHVLNSVQTVALGSPKATQTLAKKFGMHMQSLDDQLAQAFHLPTTDGVLVAYVEADSQAARHGIRRGDVILRVDGHLIKTIKDVLASLTDQTAHPHILLLTRDQGPITIRLDLSAIE
jgi:bifunctional DNase/RNase